ncbi:MAG: phosphatase PAP2 family protein [Oscillospiraceae bacterium]|nr:phosphatase PAP2 family protein [Oscillospiraceae bacterium]
MTNKLSKPPLIPKYMYLPFFLVVVFHFSSYWFTKAITENSIHYDFSISIDSQIPFVPFFITFYILAYFQWLFSYVYHCRQSKECCYQLLTSDLLAKLVCTFCFLLFPTTIVRPTLDGSGIFENITGIIFFLDTPVNLFPSMHCLMSWFCFRSSLTINKPSFIYSAVQLFLSLLVFASTVLVKQHFFIDIISGIMVAEICWLITKRFSLWHIFLKIKTSDNQIKADEKYK